MNAEAAPGGQDAAPEARRGRERDGRKRILAAALDLFAEKGFDSVSTAEIAKEAGSSQSVVHYHFETKEALWQQAMRDLIARIDARQTLNLDEYRDLPLEARFKVLLRRYVIASAQVPELGRVLFREGLSGGPRLTWLLRELGNPQFGMLRNVINELQAKGRLTRWDTVALTLSIHGAGSMIYNSRHLMMQLTRRDPFSDEAVQQHADMLIAAFGGLLDQD